MAQTLSVIFRKQPFGRTRCNVNSPYITKRSAVFLTAAAYGPRPTPAGTVQGTHLTAASIVITNIAPHDPEGGDGGVEFYLHVDTHELPDVIVTIMVFEPVEAYVTT